MKTLKQIKSELKDMKENGIKITSARGNEYEVIVVLKKYFENMKKFKTLKIFPHEVSGIIIYNVSWLENGKTQSFWIRKFGGE